MCGIVGYVGQKRAVDVVVEGLRRMEYRGYDSAGVGLLEPGGELTVVRKAGKLANLEKELETVSTAATAGLGHTRWATHGAPNDANAHPHQDGAHRVALVHNGIIENFAELRAELLADGVVLTSDTDTEVAAHLLSAAFAESKDLTDAMRTVCRRLEGAFTLVAVHADTPGEIVAARRDSPLVVGLGAGESFLASDVSAFISHTRRALEIRQDQVVTITVDGATVTDLAGNEVAAKEWTVDWDAEAAEKGGHPYFMLKEIEEQPKALADTLRGRIGLDGVVVMDELRLRPSDFRRVDKVFIVACGSAFHAGLIAKYAIEHWCRLPCEVEVSSEFRYRDPVLDSDTLVLAISQSGETADTLQAVNHAREQKARVVAITNTVGSTLARQSDAVLYTRAGPEIGVAATKTFLTQIAATYLVGLYLAEVRGAMLPDEVESVVRQLEAVPELVRSVLDTVEPVRAIARKLATDTVPQVLFIGRHVAYPMALEGALKLMELSYLPAQGFAAGELKHGPIARIDQGTPVVVIALERDRLYDKVLSNIQEVRARGAHVVAIADGHDSRIADFADDVVRVPRTSVLLSPLVTAVPLQVLACELALALGLDVDKPRNLAKSVTVE